jgi:hypothetical protein
MPATLLITLVAAFTFGGATAQKVDPFVGTWISEFQGTVWVRLELTAAGGSLGGRLSIGNMEVDGDGRLKAVQEVPDRLSSISDVVLAGQTLTFTQKDGDDTNRFEMRLTGSEAELHFVLDEATRKELAESGVGAPKPALLKRVVR